MADVFLSYHRSTAAHAQAVATALRATGYEVWLDEQLPAHRTYSDVIEEHLGAAKAVVVIWSAEAVRSEWVRAEANAGRAARKLVQLSVDGAKLPLPFDQIHCADLTDWHSDPTAPGWRKVLASIAELTGTAPGAPAAAAKVATSSPLRVGTAASVGERKTVTVLCAELNVASELRDELDPEDVLAIIEPARRLLIETVSRYDGYVVPGTGAGILVLFGAPLPHEDHPQQAIYAALTPLHHRWIARTGLRHIKGDEEILEHPHNLRFFERARGRQVTADGRIQGSQRGRLIGAVGASRSS